MQKKPTHIPYELAKISFGIYLVDELMAQGGKELPTETDVKKILLRINPACTAAELQTARQISRYCQLSKSYLRDAREETLDKVAKAINAPIKSLVVFREKINPLLKAFKYYSSYLEKAETYLKSLGEDTTHDDKLKFCELFACAGQPKIYLSMISYHFGEVNKDLPAISFGAESDLRTERIIRELFDAFGLPAPQYLPDNIFFEQLATRAAKTVFIAIGLFGNRLTEWMGRHNILPPWLEILPAEKCIRLYGKNYHANRDEAVDYALFCKIVLNTGSIVFILGGIEGFGTQRLGEYIEENWPLLHKETARAPNRALLFKSTPGAVEMVALTGSDD